MQTEGQLSGSIRRHLVLETASELGEGAIAFVNPLITIDLATWVGGVVVVCEGVSLCHEMGECIVLTGLGSVSKCSSMGKERRWYIHSHGRYHPSQGRHTAGGTGCIPEDVQRALHVSNGCMFRWRNHLPRERQLALHRGVGELSGVKVGVVEEEQSNPRFPDVRGCSIRLPSRRRIGRPCIDA